MGKKKNGGASKEKKKKVEKKKKPRSKKAIAKREFCPKCGAGYRLAEHKDRRTCGKCGYTAIKTATAGTAAKE